MAGSDDEYAATQNAAASQSGAAVGGGCAVCHTGNWIHVRYEYTEGDPVTDAVYVVQTPNGGEPGGTVLAEGVISIGPDAAHEYVHVDLGDHSGEVEVFVFDDPTEPVPYNEPQPVEDERGWFARAADSIMSGVEWTWDIAQGDFNEDMATGQIITNAIVTAVPVVDQVADARDLIANGKALIWDRRYTEIGVWVGVFACLIGLVPSLGSLAKGVIKLIWRNVGEVGKILIYINKALHRTGMRVNGYRFLKKLADGLIGHIGFVTQKFNEFLDLCVQRIPRWTGEDLRETIEHVRGMATQMFPQVAQEIRERLLRGLADFASRAWRVMPGQGIVIRRAMQAITHLGPHPSWLNSMSRRIEITNLEVGARQITDADMAKFIRLEALAEEWADDLIRAANTPASIKNLPRSVLIDVMSTFGSRPVVRTFSDDETMTVYRVVGNEDQVGGPFWSRSAPPDTEEAWRARDAVLNEWNDAGAYVRSTIPPPDSILVGEIGPQDLGRADQAPKPGQMLDGGGEQLWLPRHPEGPAGRLDGYFHTEWNRPIQASRAIVRVGNPNECDL